QALARLRACDLLQLVPLGIARPGGWGPRRWEFGPGTCYTAVDPEPDSEPTPENQNAASGAASSEKRTEVRQGGGGGGVRNPGVAVQFAMPVFVVCTNVCRIVT